MSDASRIRAAMDSYLEPLPDGLSGAIGRVTHMLAKADAVDPLRQARGNAGPPPTVMAAIEDVRYHVSSWTMMLSRYVKTLPEETDECDRLYAAHELEAMERDLTALIAAVDLLPEARVLDPDDEAMVECVARAIHVVDFTGHDQWDTLPDSEKERLQRRRIEDYQGLSCRADYREQARAALTALKEMP